LRGAINHHLCRLDREERVANDYWLRTTHRSEPFLPARQRS
jgi:hypothetical protein